MGGGGGGGTGGVGVGGSPGTACVVKAGIYTVDYKCGAQQFQAMATWAVAKDLVCPSDTSRIPLPSGDLSAVVPGKTFCSAIGSYGTGLVWTPDGAVGSASLELNCSSSKGTTLEMVLCGVTITH